jgi:hypothetical protein
MQKMRVEIDAGYLEALKDTRTGSAANESAMHILLTVYHLLYRDALVPRLDQWGTFAHCIHARTRVLFK